MSSVCLHLGWGAESVKEKRLGEGLESSWRQVDNAPTDIRDCWMNMNTQLFTSALTAAYAGK